LEGCGLWVPKYTKMAAKMATIKRAVIPYNMVILLLRENN